MIDDIVFEDVQYVEIKMDSITTQSPNVIIFGSDDSTDFEPSPSGGGESISIF